MVNQFGTRSTIRSVGGHLVGIHGNTERQLGKSGSCYMLLRHRRDGKVKAIDSVSVLLAFYFENEELLCKWS